MAADEAIAEGAPIAKDVLNQEGLFEPPGGDEADAAAVDTPPATPSAPAAATDTAADAADATSESGDAASA